MTGEEANNAFTLAMSLVKQGKYDEALVVPMLESDRIVIQERIDYANCNDQQSR